MAKTLFSEAHWVGYRYELFKDDTSLRLKKVRADAIAAYDALSGDALEAANKGREYAKREREWIMESELDTRRGEVLELLKKGYTVMSVARQTNSAYGTIAKIRDELISSGELPTLDSGAWTSLARKYGRALAEKGEGKSDEA